MGRKKKITTIEETSNITPEVTQNTPSPEPKRYYSTMPEWTEYVLSFLSEKELINKRPTCDGLRRVFEILMGRIIGINSEVIQTPTIQNMNRATVKTSIKYIPINMTPSGPSLALNPDNSYMIWEYSDVADVYDGNTAKPYSNFPTATAATMAEGRCLRKMLRLVRVNTMEEVTQTADETQVEIANSAIASQPSTDLQINIIKKLSNDQDINLDKMLESEPDVLNKKLDQLSYTDAQIIIKRLGEYKNGPDKGGKILPESIIKG